MYRRYWWMLLIRGVIAVLFGLAAIFWTGLTALVLVYLIATWAIITGILEIAAAFSMRRALALEWTLAIAGILSILLGILLAFQPVSGILAVVRIIGIYAIIFGVLLIIRSFQFRSAATA